MDVETQIATGFLAIKNNHISFKSMCRHLPKKEIKKYLDVAISSKGLRGFVLTFPYDVSLYKKNLIEFEKLFYDSNPEYWI
jgi:hypothetical protein